MVPTSSTMPSDVALPPMPSTANAIATGTNAEPTADVVAASHKSRNCRPASGPGKSGRCTQVAYLELRADLKVNLRSAPGRFSR